MKGKPKKAVGKKGKMGVGDMPGAGKGLPPPPAGFDKLFSQSQQRMKAAAAAPPPYKGRPKPPKPAPPPVPAPKGKYRRGEEAYKIMGGK